MAFKEIEIPVPWGIVAGKTYGDEKYPPVIGLHGFQDNANTFDCLLPLLPKAYYYIILDLPGHGKSTQFNTKTLASIFDMVLSLKIVADYINRKKYILLGHSYGGQVITSFAQIFPEYTEKIICFDTYYYWPMSPHSFIPEIREIFKRYIKLHHLEIDTAPIYTYDEALTKCVSSAVIPRTEQTAKILLERSLIKVGDNKYKITTAQNLKYLIRPPMSISYQHDLLKQYPIQCPHLIISASSSIAFRKIVRKVLEAFKFNPKFKLVIVEGSHDVHIENPERVAPFVSNFMLNNKNKL